MVQEQPSLNGALPVGKQVWLVYSVECYGLEILISGMVQLQGMKEMMAG